MKSYTRFLSKGNSASNCAQSQIYIACINASNNGLGTQLAGLRLTIWSNRRLQTPPAQLHQGRSRRGICNVCGQHTSATLKARRPRTPVWGNAKRIIFRSCTLASSMRILPVVSSHARACTWAGSSQSNPSCIAARMIRRLLIVLVTRRTGQPGVVAWAVLTRVELAVYEQVFQRLVRAPQAPI